MRLPSFSCMPRRAAEFPRRPCRLPGRNGSFSCWKPRLPRPAGKARDAEDWRRFPREIGATLLPAYCRTAEQAAGAHFHRRQGRFQHEVDAARRRAAPGVIAAMPSRAARRKSLLGRAAHRQARRAFSGHFCEGWADLFHAADIHCARRRKTGT